MGEEALPRLLLLPGLGGDGRFYGPQRGLPLPFDVIEWIEPESQRETLAHYAERLAAGARARGLGGAGSGPLVVGGVSLGAMVALEAARHLGAEAVLLVGGCRSHRQIAPLFKAVLAAAAAMPAACLRPSLALAPLAFKLFERLNPDQSRLMTGMLRDRSPALLRWSCRAILGWECCALPPAVPVYSIHGENDEIIPLRNVKADRVVPGGHHLISLARPREVNDFIAEVMGRAAGDRARSPEPV